MKVSEIFEEEPVKWGLRGDPILWRELKERLSVIYMPESPDELKEIIEREYEVSNGRCISHEKNFGVERLKTHGMSSGGVCPEFWVNRGIPLLVSRHAKP
ncbi:MULTISPECIES: hypothetical protein [unclassified Halomonas]|uniref:hypothetical protein n=1 Tax=unclassified Halomonas TaxID=2609666 RepID=UPI0007D9C3AE|nr:MULTISPECIES: hypothetical protein [unclassified Halomonas]MBT2788256.1 hypothetical protein [Halomonas sp. ISL-106]MBT2796005.1 hypothetical protein [Halomonas sp. ISL-104]OAL61275.1 hypothetical protein A6R74_16975 [Halomonas sp. ALS9]